MFECASSFIFEFDPKKIDEKTHRCRHRIVDDDISIFLSSSFEKLVATEFSFHFSLQVEGLLIFEYSNSVGSIVINFSK